ncbi:hypothetical protein KW797_02930 [Candidatus Parcubacteria bacterium]|nr:hypothetical protein [Candidatus Parcubacteria bacterium]
MSPKKNAFQKGVDEGKTFWLKKGQEIEGDFFSDSVGFLCTHVPKGDDGQTGHFVVLDSRNHERTFRLSFALLTDTVPTKKLLSDHLFITNSDVAMSLTPFAQLAGVCMQGFLASHAGIIPNLSATDQQKTLDDYARLAVLAADALIVAISLPPTP